MDAVTRSPQRAPLTGTALVVTTLALAAAGLPARAALAAEGAPASDSPAAAAPVKPRPTVQPRFAPKTGSFFGHLVATMPIRNDLYDSFGVGADLGYYWSEAAGLELRLVALRTRLSGAADDIREKAGLTPDARPQDYLTTLGIRYAFGYGKVLAFERFVVHFDPQLVVHGGTAYAEGRVLPTMMTGLSLLTHFRWGVQVKLDLNLTGQLERRDRGWVPAFGFAPVLGVGWSYGGAGPGGGGAR